MCSEASAARSHASICTLAVESLPVVTPMYDEIRQGQRRVLPLGVGCFSLCVRPTAFPLCGPTLDLPNVVEGVVDSPEIRRSSNGTTDFLAIVSTTRFHSVFVAPLRLLFSMARGSNPRRRDQGSSGLIPPIAP